MKGNFRVIRSMVPNFVKTTAQRPQQGIDTEMLTDSGSSWRAPLMVTDLGYACSFHGSLRYQKAISVSREIDMRQKKSLMPQ